MLHRYTMTSDEKIAWDYMELHGECTSSEPLAHLPHVIFETRDGNSAYAEFYEDGVWLAFWS